MEEKLDSKLGEKPGAKIRAKPGVIFSMVNQVLKVVEKSAQNMAQW